MNSKIIVTQYAQASCLNDLSEPKSGLAKHLIGKETAWGGKLTPKMEEKLQQLLAQNPNYQKLDRTVHLALLCARAFNFNPEDQNLKIGVNIGSSRGATHKLESEFEAFFNQENIDILTSPTTSLGNISSWVGQDLGLHGIQFSHSMTCSTSLLSVANAVAWLRANMTDKMLAGGAEAPLTPFTIAQSKALRIYSREKEIPCLAGDLNKSQNTMVLGEGAGLLLLEKETEQNKNQKIVEIAGIGYTSEPLASATSISAQATHFQASMREAIRDLDEPVDVVITHTPGTRKGDQAEYEAVKAVFGKELSLITNNKWKIGHTFGAAGVLSLIYGIEMIKNQDFYALPWDTNNAKKRPIKNVLINAAGFGGNAVSVLIKR
ncbi:beta-ketoacyl synthase [Ornithobacterium rhinotracheale]|uniref:beta-ketoacyl synthase N-terminal-like domain-containing protein n=1 Tax=Ornithobacterium rhinotracheale TaxID=28251 RepID=UPI001FF32B1F|nr:beta-ketoacyl synthase N-terminal-like domain-containing protein [Ornithobacterium rhinotracheale]MCK0202032.1 beta-ketoacyl synthase [Ornithobacterium rhinotracheale]